MNNTINSDAPANANKAASAEAVITGGFGNVRMTLTIKDDKIIAAEYAILGEDRSVTPAAAKAAELAVGMDIIDALDLRKEDIEQAFDASEQDSIHYAKYAAAAVGFAVRNYYRRDYDAFLESIQDADSPLDGFDMPESLRGFGACGGCGSSGGSCSQGCGDETVSTVQEKLEKLASAQNPL